MKRHWKKIIVCLAIFTVLGGFANLLFRGQIPSSTHEYAIRLATIFAVSEDNDRRLTPQWPQCCDPWYSETLEPYEVAELWLSICTFGSQSGHVNWRSLYRDDENIRVVYFSITETTISVIHREILNGRDGRLRTQSRFHPITALYGIELPQRVEVYYLRNLHRRQRRINRLSDEGFDALRLNAVRVLNGVID